MTTDTYVNMYLNSTREFSYLCIPTLTTNQFNIFRATTLYLFSLIINLSRFKNFEQVQDP